MNHSDSHASVAAPPAARPWPRGQHLGQFELIETAASGDGGFVYRAFDHALARQVAVKEYLPAALAGRDANGSVLAAPHAVHTFERCRDALVDTWRTLARCDHPSLVRMLHLAEAHGTVYGVMPWYAGRSLAEVPPPEAAPLDETTLRALLDDLLGALETYHRAGRVHGAISASKVLRLDGGGALLLGPGAPVRAAERIDAAPLGPWTDLNALATLVERLAARHAGLCSAALRQALDAATSSDIARRPLSVAQFRAWLAAVPPPPAAAAAAPAGADRPGADTDVDAATVDVIRRVLDSIPDPVAQPRRPAPPPPPAESVQPVQPMEPSPFPFSAMIGDDAPPFAPTPYRSRRPARRAHWGVRLGLALIFATGAAMIAWQLEQPGARAALEGLLAELPFGAAPAPAPAARPAPVSPGTPAPVAVTAAPERATPNEPAASAPPVARAPEPAAAPTAAPPPPVAATVPPPTAARPAVAAPPAPPAGPTSPRAVCGARSGFSLYRCMQQQCRLDRWYPHGQCVRLRETDAVD